MENEKHAGGRPPLWPTVEDFEKASTGFFEWCEENGYIPDIEGLAVFLDCSRETIREYESKQKFSGTIKRIKNKIAFFKKQLAMTGSMNSKVFTFDFVNNHDYKEKTETDLTSGGKEIRSIAPHQFVATQTEKKDGDNNDKNTQ